MPRKTITFEEADALVKENFPNPLDQCPLLCRDYQDAFERYENATGKQKTILAAQIAAYANQMKRLGCPPCHIE